MRSWMFVASVAACFGIAAGNAGCGTVETTGSGAAGGTGGTGGAGGTGGSGAGGAMCPAEPGEAPCGGGSPENDGLRCEYDTKPCPTILACSSSATHGGWLAMPPEKGSACEAAGEVCTYVDDNFDSGQKTTWTATCSPEKTWTVDEMIENNGP